MFDFDQLQIVFIDTTYIAISDCISRLTFIPQIEELVSISLFKIISHSSTECFLIIESFFGTSACCCEMLSSDNEA